MVRVPTEEEVAALRPSHKASWRFRLRRQGTPLPSYLLPRQKVPKPPKPPKVKLPKAPKPPRVPTEAQLAAKAEKERRREERALVREERAREQARRESLKRRGFPKRLPCLACGRLRMTKDPSERLHHYCRRGDVEPLIVRMDRPDRRAA